MQSSEVGACLPGSMKTSEVNGWSEMRQRESRVIEVMAGGRKIVEGLMDHHEDLGFCFE